MIDLPTETATARELAIAAEVFLRVDSARQYGFITGGPEVDVARCEEAIEHARRLGAAWETRDVDEATTRIIGALA